MNTRNIPPELFDCLVNVDWSVPHYAMTEFVETYPIGEDMVPDSLLLNIHLSLSLKN